MKKLIAMFAFVTVGMFAATQDSTASSAPSTVTESAPSAAMTEDDGSAELRATCPQYAPKCCDRLPSGCVNCVGWNQECP